MSRGLNAAQWLKHQEREARTRTERRRWLEDLGVPQGWAVVETRYGPRWRCPRCGALKARENAMLHDAGCKR